MRMCDEPTSFTYIRFGALERRRLDTRVSRHDRPYVVMPHGMLDPYSLSVKARKKSIYLQFFESHNMARAQRMIYTTSEEERLAALAGLPLPPGELVPLGARASSSFDRRPCDAQFLARFPQAEGKRRLLFLGRLHHKKGLDRILNCLQTCEAIDTKCASDRRRRRRAAIRTRH